jgi:plasmid maintenance system antidote protein VapI
MTMTEALRRMFASSGLTYLQIERATGLKRASIMRFVQGEQSLRLDCADRLAAFFGIHVVLPKRKGTERGQS